MVRRAQAVGFRSDDRGFERLWPTVTHLIGKDILILHAVYWLTMLKAIGLSPPRTIFAHGWWNVDGAKMSKSVGNVVKPLDLAGIFGTDAFRYFLVRDMAAGRDAEFSEELVRQRYEGTLANDLGNLAHRLVHMIAQYCDGAIPDGGTAGDQETELRDRCAHLVIEVFENVNSFAFDEALRNVEGVVRELNRYVERNAPWVRFKNGEHEDVRRVLYCSSEALRLVSVVIYPVMPQKTNLLWQRLGWIPDKELADGLKWGGLRPGSKVTPGPALFPRKR